MLTYSKLSLSTAFMVFVRSNYKNWEDVYEKKVLQNYQTELKFEITLIILWIMFNSDNYNVFIYLCIFIHIIILPASAKTMKNRNSFNHIVNQN